MSTLQQKQLFDELETLPLDIKTKVIDKLLNSINPVSKPVDELWIKEVNKRKDQIDQENITLLEGEEVFKKLSQRLNS